ncbi:type II toxin-antitoxin system mRNA interferase toxin, RelE/StbE family [Microcoleus vaginatus GB1-A2]|uniref:type II toxin-antitoxin system mRNA interferase toxin, RelE/StbE family n=1 Tax=Microcoleus vaginatus TaxID=119532 RepID=UPI00168425BA|nr:type II toxin-antitoxin system mRNA interferase toxin, RelE/StbE family [Microcoleus sp. FACHB-61]
MKTQVWNNSFKRAFKRVIKRNPQLGEKIFSVLELLVNDPFSPSLKAHKLRGQLEGLWACWVESDCRIIYTFEQDNETQEELIVLIDIGTHDEVY